VGNILGKPKNKLKDFLDNSKKLVQTPKELPELMGERRPEAQSLPPVPQRPQISISQAQNQAPKEIKPLELPVPKKELRLPKIEHPTLGGMAQQAQQSQPLQPPSYQQKPVKAHEEDLKRFEEAISNINIDIIHSETPADAHSSAGESREDGYYKPIQMGEGYFSEIEHYIKNKDVNEIINDVLKKDFLAGMKDYHDTKAQGKPFFFNKDDLKNKLKMKMDALRRLEEEWHIIRTQVAEEERKRMIVEREIDQQSQELKELFKQIKLNQWLEHEAPKEHYFRLVNGQELKSLNDLRKALTYMSDDEFRHHVNNERNDFATWIKEALQNTELYEKIRSIKTKEELQTLLQNPI
jgi:hypothetical protein